jgi:hypothetical protein
MCLYHYVSHFGARFLLCIPNNEWTLMKYIFQKYNNDYELDKLDV